jgi:hypothetical protein
VAEAGLASVESHHTIVNHKLSARGWRTFSDLEGTMSYCGKMHLDTCGKMHLDTCGKMHLETCGKMH